MGEVSFHVLITEKKQWQLKFGMQSGRDDMTWLDLYQMLKLSLVVALESNDFITHFSFPSLFHSYSPNDIWNYIILG
jgi:hypothetical protein